MVKKLYLLIVILVLIDLQNNKFFTKPDIIYLLFKININDINTDDVASNSITFSSGNDV